MKKLFLLLVGILVLYWVCEGDGCRDASFADLSAQENVKYVEIEPDQLESAILSLISRFRPTPSNRRVDISLIIDRTSSMEDNLSELYALSDKLLNEVSNIMYDVRFTLAFFTDHDDGVRSSPNVTTIYDRTTNIELVQNQIRRTMKAMKKTDGGLDLEECAWDGIHDVVAKAKWRSNSVRILLLITDAPVRERCPFHQYTSSSVREALDSIEAQLGIVRLPTPRLLQLWKHLIDLIELTKKLTS